MAVAIQTSQNVLLEYEPASIGDRILATLLDYFVFLGWIIFTVALPLSGLKMNLGTFYYLLVVVLPIFVYDFICEWFLNGQSVGKLALNIRVVMLDGSQPGIGAYLLRWLMRLVDTRILNGLVAVIAIAANGKGQRIGDLAAGTTVVKLTAKVALHQVLYNTLPEGYVPQFTEARQLIDRDIRIIREVLRQGQPEAVDRTANKVKAVMAVTSDLSARQFLQTVLNDYQFLALQE